MEWWDRKEDARAACAADRELWCLVEGTDGRYAVSNMGHIVAGTRAGWRIIGGSRARNGYVTVGLTLAGRPRPRTFLLHRLIVEAFDGQPPTHEHTDVRHSPDPSGLNNRLSNLCWGTRAENARDRWLQEQPRVADRSPSGDQRPNPTYSLDPRLVRVGLELHAAGKITITDLADLWDVSFDVADRVVKGGTWTHIDRPPPVPRKAKRPQTERDRILAMLRAGDGRDEINAKVEHPLTHQELYYYRDKLRSTAAKP